MPLPLADTAVSYPDGATASAGTVLHVEPLTGGRTAILLDTTAFHPGDRAWPDQPADRGTITTAAGTRPVVDAVTGGIHEGQLFLGADLPVRTGTEDWIFVVGHIVDGDGIAVGDSAQIDVDADHRLALSAGHTACHLASLALDAALADAWTKPVATDALGHPAFDALAIQTSKIGEFGSIDVYRIGKSLRRKGFVTAALDDPAAVAARADAHLARWIGAGGSVRIERAASGLSDRRTWVCELADGRTDIPCGGTHLDDLGRLSAVTTSLVRTEVDGGLELRMETTARRAHPRPRPVPPAETP